MTAEERELRGELHELAESDRGRRLLQLALRGIDHGEAEVTAGCWTEHGVREGVFRDEGRPGDWIGSLVGSRGHATVLNAIGAFDRLAKRHHADRTPRRILPDKVEIRTGEWRQVVERMLVETLADSPVA